MEFVLDSFIAGIFASIACGLGALPLLIKRIRLEENIGLGYAFAGGLMLSASVYNLLLPAFTVGPEAVISFWAVVKTLVGLGLGCWFLWSVESYLTPERLENSPMLRRIGGRTEALVFLAMSFHSIPEGVAVGVGYAGPMHDPSLSGLGLYIALAVAIHNIPEGLAVSLPLRSAGASIKKCFFMAFLTSLPQPLAAVPAALLVWLFQPLLIPLFGLAAGAMMYLVIAELIPDALKTQSSARVAWAFMAGFSLMLLVQTLL